MTDFPAIVAGCGAWVDLAQAERRALGHMLGHHPLRQHAATARAVGAVGLAAVDDLLAGGAHRVRCAALPIKVYERRTKAGEWMAILYLEDVESRREAVCFPRTWAKVADEVEDCAKLARPMRLELSGGAGKLVVDAAGPLLAWPELPSGPPLRSFAAVDIETTEGPTPGPDDPRLAHFLHGKKRSKKVDERLLWLASQRVVEVGVALFEAPPGGGVRCSQKLSRLVDPLCPMSEGSRAVHGLTDEDVRGQPTFADRAPRLASALAGREIVTYNGRGFDLLVLAAEFAAAGVAWKVDPSDTVDVYELVRTRYAGRADRPISRKLADQCDFHGVQRGQSHRAGDDAQATGELLCKLVRGGWASPGVLALRRGLRRY